MLTCTVSMVETAVAIIATCLPRPLPLVPSASLSPFPSTDNHFTALRTVLLGHSSSAGTGSNYGHYELSSAGHNRSRRTQQSRITTNIVGGTQQRGNDSEDELVKEVAVSVASGAGGSVASGTGTRTQDKSGITVSTTLQMHHGRGDATRSEAKYSNFA